MTVRLQWFVINSELITHIVNARGIKLKGIIKAPL